MLANRHIMRNTAGCCWLFQYSPSNCACLARRKDNVLDLTQPVVHEIICTLQFCLVLEIAQQLCQKPVQTLIDRSRPVNMHLLKNTRYVPQHNTYNQVYSMYEGPKIWELSSLRFYSLFLFLRHQLRQDYSQHSFHFSICRKPGLRGVQIIKLGLSTNQGSQPIRALNQSGLSK